MLEFSDLVDDMATATVVLIQNDVHERGVPPRVVGACHIMWQLSEGRGVCNVFRPCFGLTRCTRIDGGIQKVSV